MRRYLALCLIALAALLVWWVMNHAHPVAKDLRSSSVETPPAKTSTQSSTPSLLAPRPSAFPEAITLLPTSASANDLHKPNITPEEDLSLVHSLLRSHRRALGGNPIGLNDEITASLTGRNIKGAASLPKNHPAISQNGELLDRYGTPYRFHALSGKLMKIRSAGVDKTFFTEDDLLLTE